MFFFVLLMCGSVGASLPDPSYVSVGELTDVLKTRDIDHILKTLNAVKRMAYQGEILPFVHDLWEGRKDKYPDLPWATINADIVRVNLADILLQAAANGKITVDKEKIHRYVSGLVNSKDSDVAVTAILALSPIDDEKDVGAILAVARQQKPATFRASVVALSQMCNPAAARALDQLEASVTKTELKSYVSETVRQSQSFKERTHWCEGSKN